MATETQELPRVPTPDLVVEFATVYYQAEYKKMDTAKEIIGKFHKIYDSLGDIEKLYLTEFEATAADIARGLHKISLRYNDRRKRTKRIRDSEIQSAEGWRDRKLGSLSELKEDSIAFVERAVPAGIAYVGAELANLPESLRLLALLGTGYVAHFLLKKYSISREDKIQVRYETRVRNAMFDFKVEQERLEEYVDNASLNSFSRGERKLRKAYEKHFDIVIEEEISAEKFDSFARIMKAEDMPGALEEYVSSIEKF